MLISLNPFAGATAEGLKREILDLLFFSLEVTKLLVLSFALGSHTQRGSVVGAASSEGRVVASTCVLLMIGVCAVLGDHSR